MDLHTEEEIDRFGHEIHNCICSLLHNKYAIKEFWCGDPTGGRYGYVQFELKRKEIWVFLGALWTI